MIVSDLRERNRITPLGIAVLLTTVACVIALVVWRLRHPDVTSGTFERIRATGVVRIGYANEAPYGYLDSRTGRITGEAPEIARVILARLGAKRIEPVVAEFGSLIPGLQARRFDLIAAGMYITPERAAEIDFSNPTYAIGEAFLVRSGNPLDLHSFEDVADHSAARLGVMGGSVEHRYARSLDVPAQRTVIFPDYPSALAGLRTDRVDAVAATVLTAQDLLRKSGEADLELAEPFHEPIIDGKPTRGFGAFGFRQDDDDFRRAFNRELARFLGSHEHLELVRPFGFSQQTLPGNLTAEQVLAAQQPAAH